MNYIVYILFRMVVLKVQLMPFWFMYKVSDFLAFILKDLVKYRRKIVYENLKCCFPEKTEEERKAILDAFYVNLSDVILEAIKGYTMSEKELHKRYNFLNRDILNKYYEQGINSVCASAHFSNWEWGVIIMAKQFPHKTFGIYKPLTNRYIDAYVARKRRKLDMDLLTMEETLKGMRAKHENPTVFILITDQSPSSRKKAIWVNFLGRKTACAPGIEMAFRYFSYPVIYILPVRIKRGHYEVKCELLYEPTDKYVQGEIIQKYMSRLEEDIRKKPSHWLWSHRRWKHTWEENTN